MTSACRSGMGGRLTCFSLMLILQFLLPFNLRAISESISLATTTLLTRPLKSHSMDVFCSGDVNQHSTGHSPSRHTTVPLKHCRSTEDAQTGADRRMPCPSLGIATSEFRAAKYCSNIGAGVKHTPPVKSSQPPLERKKHRATKYIRYQKSECSKMPAGREVGAFPPWNQTLPNVKPRHSSSN